MKKSDGADRAARESAGCFLMLILGALMTVGTLVGVPLALVAALVEGRSTWWRSILAWIIAPGVGIALVAWFTFGFKGLGGPSRRR